MALLVCDMRSSSRFMKANTSSAFSGLYAHTKSMTMHCAYSENSLILLRSEYTSALVASPSTPPSISTSVDRQLATTPASRSPVTMARRVSTKPASTHALGSSA